MYFFDSPSIVRSKTGKIGLVSVNQLNCKNVPYENIKQNKSTYQRKCSSHAIEFDIAFNPVRDLYNVKEKRRLLLRSVTFFKYERANH